MMFQEGTTMGRERGEEVARSRGDREKPPSSEVVVGLDDERALDHRVVGNKAARLARLRQSGFRVPDGAVLVASWCESLPPDRDDVEGAVEAALTEVGEGPYAVRSSGLAEDGDEEAMAGRYRTELEVDSRGVTEAVKRCIEQSAEIDRRDRREHAPIAILIQRLVSADCAGVAFTRNPVTGDDETVVSATRGLGDKLVGGEVAGDRWTVREGTPNGGPENEGVLSDDEVREIADQAARVESLYREPQDIEWAWAEDGLHLLQTRPITALPVPPPETEPPAGTWVKDHSHYPNGLTPLAASVYSSSIEEGFEYCSEKWGLMVERVEQLVHRHECYVRPVPVGGKDGPPPPALLMGIIGRLVPALRRRAKTAKRALDGGLGEELFDRWETEDRRRVEEAVRELRETDRGQLSDEELMRHFDDCVELLHEGQRIHFALFIPYVTPLYDLAMFTEEALDWGVHRTLELLAGLSEETSGPARELRELAEQIAGTPAEAIVRDADVHANELAEALSEVSDEAATGWDRFVDQWGHRVMGYDPGDPTLAEHPELIRRRLLELLEGGAERRSGLRERRERAEREAKSGLTGGERERFEELLAAARRGWPMREENVAYTDSMTNAVVRYAGLAIGERLAERGQLDGARDMAMLSRDELFEALAEGDDMRAVARRRHAERAWVAAHPGPPVLGGPEHPPPNLKYMPEAVRRTSGALMWMMNLEYSPASEGDDSEVLTGQPGAPGRAEGTVRIVNGPEDFHRVRAGDVMVCPTTTPAWTIVFPTLSGIVAEGGGALAHASIAAREHHIPAVLGVNGARQRLDDGMTVEIDGTGGRVRVIS